jgi:hypothetical protein
MGRSQIFESIFATVSTDATLMALLGIQTPTNRRVYRSFAQLQSFLLGPPLYEPRVSEGWLVIEELPPGLSASRAQYDSVWEILDINMHVFATTYGLGDDIADILDKSFSWSVEQQRDVMFGNYYVVFSRAWQSGEKYAEDIKLAQKTRMYRLELVLSEQFA